MPRENRCQESIDAERERENRCQERIGAKREKIPRVNRGIE